MSYWMRWPAVMYARYWMACQWISFMLYDWYIKQLLIMRHVPSCGQRHRHN